MIFFRVTQNINIKTTDGTLVNYFKLRVPSNLENETVYITTYDDFKDIKNIFAKVDKEKYFAKTLNEETIRSISTFPIELGIPNINEIENRENQAYLEFLNIKPVDIFKQLKAIDKNEVKFAFIGGVGSSISDIISSCTALRILHKKLKEVYKNIKFDIFINASNNSFYTRDKQLYETQDFINNVFPLSLTSKKLCEYDYFFDNSFDIKIALNLPLNNVDKWLYKFGIDYKKIDENEKYNQLNISNYKVSDSLIKKIEEAKLKGKLLLFHPYSANINKSIPQAIAASFLKELLLKADDYIIISTLQIDSKIKEDNYIDLSKESKNLNDFIYIVSCMNKIITTDTSTYHISDAFMVPTIGLFTQNDFGLKSKYYKYLKVIYIKDKSKNLSKFIYENESLTFYKFESWKKIKIKQIIKLLDKF
ncbi:glycosyltransferase family 9 protein [Arcobacter sp. s6]|jgi:hypothetical protein|uniref:glycosyltransferase family 9 protein n=1 Tax=Arcobacter sp. s6 TaxID=3230363 RepID=UPI0034A04A30